MFNWLTQTVAGVPQGTSGSNLTQLATMFANIAIIISAGLATVSLAYAFVMYVTSAGDPKAAQKASRALTWGIIALIVTMVAWGIKTILFKLLNIKGLA